MTFNKKPSAAVQAKTRKAFGRSVAMAHGRKREAREGDLASRNAYRLAGGLPLITSTTSK